ncbi:peptidoglycan DD-metalloendopeptidase family protein, partial [Pelagibacteraceae bacterium]|nr:peptidoglycan DD-metalloendopeptidase family protein [Pelagibacteraceae bacterium]
SYNKSKQNNLKAVITSSDFLDLKEYFINNLKSPYKEYKYIIKNNDSIEKILSNYNIKYSETKDIVNQLKKKELSNIYSGREVSIVIKENNENENSLINIIYPVSNTLTVEIRKKEDTFKITENIIKLSKKEVVAKNTIKNNLYSAAVEVGIEPNIIIEFARIYGFEVDFQRDIRKGDWFEIYYEKFIDDNDVVRDTGKIIYASMYVNNKEINLYNFKYKNETGYYDLNGKSIVKSLMKTPINGARLSSSFGNRKHPILGYTKLHTGTDFAAPSGTPIMASGSGTVTRARWCGGGGNCIKIKHNTTYQTVYAHMKNFAKGIKEGKKVKQGQIIGYVGSTGMSTGPHLHYEVIVNGKKVNSQRLKLPSAKRLDKIARKEFEIDRIKIDLKLDALREY